MQMVSYWKGMNGESSPMPFYDEDGELFLIAGYYDHKNQGRAVKSVGVYWYDSYPVSRDRLAPCVIPSKTAKCLLKGLFIELLSVGEKEKADKVAAVIKFLMEE